MMSGLRLTAQSPSPGGGPAPAPSGLTLGDWLPAVGVGSAASCWPAFSLSLTHQTVGFHFSVEGPGQDDRV